MFRPLPDLYTALTQHRLATGLWQVQTVPGHLAGGLAAFGWSVIELRLTADTTKEQLLDDLGNVGAFPDHYGRNWDAAADCLTEIPLTAPLVIIVRGGGDWADAHARDASIFADIINDTATWFGNAQQLAYGIWEGQSPLDGTAAFERL